MTYPDARTAVAALASRSATLADLREIVTSFPDLRPVVAAYPDTDDDLLVWLRELHDPLVDAQLARRAGSPVVASPPPLDPQPPLIAEVFRDSTERLSTQGGEMPTAAASVPPRSGPLTPVFTPVAESPEGRRRLWPVVVALAAAVLVLGGGIGAAFATGLLGGPAAPDDVRSTPRTSAASSSPRSSVVASQPAPSPSHEAGPSSPAAPTPAPTATQKSAFTCWDGTPAAALSACGSPEGVAGLRYVFPSLDGNLNSSAYTCKMVDYPKRDAYTFSYDCRLPGESPQSSPQIVRYRFWTDEKAAMKHYKGIFADTGSSADFVLEGQRVGTVFHSNGPLPEGQGRYAIAFVVLDGHLCLSIEGSSQALLDDMIKEARFRVPDEFRGYSGDRPTEVSWHE